MTDTISRRGFITVGSLAGLAAATSAGVLEAAPAVVTGRTKPVIISAGNGYTRKNGGDANCVETAFRHMVEEGDDVLESLIHGVNIVELDPEETSVGYGGLPNADGVVQLDSCVMHGPKRRAGGVAALEGVRTPSNVAHAVMELTDHHLLVGEGAQRFARNVGFEIEDDLNTDTSRKLWLEWKRRVDPGHYPSEADRIAAGMRAAREMVREGLIDAEGFYGTINCNGINPSGDVCGVTTTSGLAWKIPGRVGDSPILGAGLYVDNEVGAAGSTGRGEANLYGLNSFLIVEEMRRGKHPKDAAIAALKRVKANTVEKRLINDRGLPKFDLRFYVLNKRGEYAGVAMYAGAEKAHFAVCTENGAEYPRLEPLLDGVSDA